MQLTIAPPLLFALGIRILLNTLNPDHILSTSDYLLQGLWQGILLYHTLVHSGSAELVFLVASVIVGFAGFEILRNGFDATKCATCLLGVAVGVLVTNVLSQVLEDGDTSELDASKEKKASNSGNANGVLAVAAPGDSSRRTRKVSFGRNNNNTERHHHRTHHSHTHTHKPTRERDRERDRDRETRPSHAHSTNPPHAHSSQRRTQTQAQAGSSGYDPALRSLHLVSPVPTLAYSIDTAPSISITSVSSSIDPKGTMSPAEREVAILRARASLADSERRRFKEERKWALSMGNKARANQLAWQVKRYAALMESYHREADAKIVEAARAQPQPIPFPSQGTSSQRQNPISQSQTYPASSSTPLVSVTVGTAPTTTRARKPSGSGGIGNGKAVAGPPVTYKPASGPPIYVHGRDPLVVKR